MQVEGLIYFITGLIITTLYLKKKRDLSKLTPENLPEMEKGNFFIFKSLLSSVYDRSLLLGGYFLFFSIMIFIGFGHFNRVVFFIALVGLFIYNVLPRNKVMQVIEASGLSMDVLKKRGIRL